MLSLIQQIRRLLDLLRPEINSKVVQKQAGQKKSHDEHSHEQTFFIGQRVMARNYRAGSVLMLGTFVKGKGPLSYLINVNGDQLWKSHIYQLREQENTPSEHPLQDWQPQTTQGM